MFDFIDKQSLREQDFNRRETEYLIDGFIAKRFITLIYADGGMGKTWLAMAIAKQAAEQSMNVLYLDFDNPIDSVEERGVLQKLIKPYPSLHYVHEIKRHMESMQIIDSLCQRGTATHFEETLIVLDSLRNIEDIGHDYKALLLMKKLMKLREFGATVLILSHANKDGKNYQGSNNIRNSVDNMYRLDKLDKLDAPHGQLKFLLKTTKIRVSIKDQAYILSVDALSLQAIDIGLAQLSDDDKKFIAEVRSTIKARPGINKTELLDALGFKKDDKTARNRLNQYNDQHWICEKAKGVFTYKLNKKE